MSKLKKTLHPVIHIIFCVMILLMPVIVMLTGKEWDARFYANYLLRMSGLILVFYINYLYLIENFLFKRRFFSYLFINLLILAGLASLQSMLSEIIWPMIDAPMHPHRKAGLERPKPPVALRMIGDLTSMVFSIGMSVALRVTGRWYRDSINLEAIKASRLEADLRNLRSQLNPHFLFNTLNNIYSLVTIDAQKAQETIHRLSGLLRFILYENNDTFVPVDKELEFTQRYIDLMGLRLNRNVKLNVLIKNDACQKEIASLLFITLIENAFKHGISGKQPSFIDIQIGADEQKGVWCVVENSIDNDRNEMETQGSGIGLANLRKRLELLYPNRHRLEIKSKEDVFSALLHIEFETDKKGMKV